MIAIAMLQSAKTAKNTTLACNHIALSVGGKTVRKGIMIKDGWHKIYNFDVYVEDDRVLRGIKKDRNGGEVTAYPYSACKTGGWDNASGVKVDTFRRGLKDGRYILF